MAVTFHQRVLSILLLPTPFRPMSGWEQGASELLCPCNVCSVIYIKHIIGTFSAGAIFPSCNVPLLLPDVLPSSFRLASFRSHRQAANGETLCSMARRCCCLPAHQDRLPRGGSRLQNVHLHLRRGIAASAPAFGGGFCGGSVRTGCLRQKSDV